MAGGSGDSMLLTLALQAKLERIASNEGFVDPLFMLGEGTKTGEGFIGVVFRVYVEEQDNENAQVTLPLFIKCLPPISPADHIFRIDKFFRTETIFYDVIQPAFYKFQKDRGMKKIAPTAPRCFDASDAIILEDMRPMGYAMKDGDYILDFAHCSAFLKELGRLHAVSLAMKDQEPDIYKDITKDLEESFVNTSPSTIMMDRFDRAVAIAVKEFKSRVTLPDKVRYVEILEKFLDEDYYTKITDLLESQRAEPYNVVNHGDCWSNNALFKYEEDDKTVPTGICLVDFQIVRNVSPVIDVTTLIFLCTTKELRDERYKDLLAAYYDSLAGFLRELGSDPDKVFPYAAFEDQLKTFGRFALGMAVHETPLVTYNAEDEQPIEVNNSEIDPAFTLTHANSDLCWSRVCDVIIDMVDLGYVD